MEQISNPMCRHWNDFTPVKTPPPNFVLIVAYILGNIKNVQHLLQHPSFDIRNPNKVYSLIGGFCSSSVNFHAKDGSGYECIGDMY
jgi:aminopeptidase N